MELTLEQIAIVGFIATIIAQLVKLFFERVIQKPINRKVITIVVYLPALIMSVIWVAPGMPVFPVLSDDPAVFMSIMLRYIGDLLVVATAISGASMVIYNLLAEQVFEKLGWQKVE